MSDNIEIVLDRSARGITMPDFELGEELADRIIDKVEETKDPYYALDNLMSFERLVNITGIAKAKVMHYLLNHWNDFGLEISFMEAMTHYSGLSSRTLVKRYVDIWDLFSSGKIPRQYQEAIKKKPINNITPLIATLDAGYNLTEDQWEEVVDAPTNRDMYVIMREIKGSEPKSDSLFFAVDRATGLIYVINQTVKYVIGKIAINVKEDAAKRGIERLITQMGMMILDQREDDEE